MYLAQSDSKIISPIIIGFYCRRILRETSKNPTVAYKIKSFMSRNSTATNKTRDALQH